MRKLRLLTYTMLPWFAACSGGGGSSTPAPPPPPPPLISAQSFNATEDTDSSATLVLQPAAGDTATVAVTTAPTRGTLAAFAATGAFTYRPNANLNGTDTFTVEATDSRNNRRSATVTINVAAVNDAPVAASEVIEVASAASITLNVLGNDTDVEDANPSVVIPPAAAGEEANPAVGTASVNASNQVQIALPVNFRGVTRVRYRVRDSAGAESVLATAVVFVGTPQFDFWYTGPRGTNESALHITDLLEAREVRPFPAGLRGYGVRMSAQKNVVVMSSGDPDGLAMRDLYSVRTQDPFRTDGRTQLTPGYTGTSRIEQFIISPDGSNVAYVLLVAGVPQVWIVPVANPSDRIQVPLAPDITSIGGFGQMRFSASGGALYFNARIDDNRSYLVRAALSDPTNPVQLSSTIEYYLSPDDSYVVTRSDALYRVPVADPALRTIINAPLPAGNVMNSSAGDATATRFIFQTTVIGAYTDHTDDRLWMVDISNPGVSTLVLDASPAHTGPIPIQAIRPDRNAALMYLWTSVGTDYQIDIAELPLSPASGIPRVLNPPPPAGSRTLSNGFYIDDDNVLFIAHEDLQLPRLYESRRPALTPPIEMIEPGTWSITPMLSDDRAVLAFAHSRSNAADPSLYGVLVNRSAPGTMLRVTTPAGSGIGIVGLVERP